MAAGYSGIHAVLRFIPGNIPRIGVDGSNVSLDWRVFPGFTFAISILTGILFGLVPALQSSRADLSSALKESTNRSGTSLRHNKTPAFALLITEMALALVLLIGAALLIRSLCRDQTNEIPGFDAHNVLTMRMSLKETPVREAREREPGGSRGVRRIRALAGVEVAGAACCVPLEDLIAPRLPNCGDDPTTADFSERFGIHSSGFPGCTSETFKIPVLRGDAVYRAGRQRPARRDHQPDAGEAVLAEQ